VIMYNMIHEDMQSLRKMVLKRDDPKLWIPFIVHGFVNRWVGTRV
jgi:hypothetical protein